MPWPLAAIGTLAILGGFVLYVVLVCRLYQRLQRHLKQRGYKSAVVLTGAGAASFLLTFVCMWPVVRLVGKDGALPWLLGLFPALPLALTPMTRLLPARNPRTAGRRVIRFPYRGFGRLLLFGLAPAIWTTAGVVRKPGLVQAGALCAAGGLACLRIARRSKLPEAATVLAADPRPPVVYLRPFQQEEDPFVALRGGWRTYWAELRRAIVTRENWWWFQTVERYLVAEITGGIGPFVALGNPLDFVPPERGAARAYVADDQWTQHFDLMVRRAAAILLVAGVSAHVAWELQRIRALGLERRLFVLTRPGPVRRRYKPVAWSRFAELLRQAGFQECSLDPGPGAVVAFEADGRMSVLQRDARTAAETVAAIARRIRD